MEIRKSKNKIHRHQQDKHARITYFGIRNVIAVLHVRRKVCLKDGGSFILSLPDPCVPT